LKQKAPEPVAVERYADKLVREYVAALLANDKDAAGKATCAMADYVMRPVNRAAIDMRDYALDARADLEKQNEKLKNQLRRWKDRAGSQE
ncbi:MAG TPA: hypothetical protein VJ654_14585, partial [Noviherbaspirillum sp.]|nr:hypothetical protein [Noviherbaspirillum sp.]